jgi:large subunit ribosomal protein L24
LALQTTLLGLAIAVILALVAALVGPLLIDWGSHRALLEAQASRLIGVKLHVAGAIDVRLLPSPRLTLHDIDLGNNRDKIHARLLGVEFALGPLMRGEWRAAELHLDGPKLSLGLDTNGRMLAPRLAIAFRPDDLSIERLSIENGTIVLADAASGTSITLGQLRFSGEARSLVGPVKGEGAVTLAGGRYPYRLSVGRLTDEDVLKLHINVDAVDHPLSIEADGMLALADGSPRFDGTLGLSRPVGIIKSVSGRPGDAVTQPWRVSAKVKATAQSALMKNVEFNYGPEDQGYRLTGVADFKFGRHPRFDGVLSGRQVDIDRAVGGAAGERQAPFAAIRRLAELGALAFRPALPIQVGIGIDQVTLGGNSVQNVRGDISSSAGGWNLDRLEFRAPGLTQVRLSGRLAVENRGVAFTGPAEVDTSDPKALASWLEGRSESTQGDLKPLSLRGDITLANERILVERLNAEFDRKPVTGRLAYFLPADKQPARLEAELKAPQIDIDAALDFGRALFAGSALERPREMTLAADIGRATLAGIDARDAHVRLKIDGDGLQLDRLSIGDFGGGNITAAGHIETGGHAPRGTLSLDLETNRTAAITAIVSKFAPERAGDVAGTLDRFGHAQLHAKLDISAGDKGAASIAQLNLTGNLDDLRVGARARVKGNWESRTLSDIDIDTTIDANEGASLVRLLELDGFVLAGKGPGQLKASVKGPAGADLTLDLRVAAAGLSALATGSGRYSESGGLTGTATLDVQQADLRSLRPGGPSESAAGLPLKLTSHVKVTGGLITLDDIDAALGESKIRGRLAVDNGSPHRIEGVLKADSVDASASIAYAIGLPRAVATGQGWRWSREPFTRGAFGKFSGKVLLEFERAELLPSLVARQVRAILRLDGNEIALDGVTAELAGGQLAGALDFRSAEDGTTMHSKFSLDHADAARLPSSTVKPPLGGSLELAMEMGGTGMSPIALVGSLKGSGRLTLDGGTIAGIDPHAFDLVAHAVDHGLPIETSRISEVVSKSSEGGTLDVNHAECILTVAAGQIRLDKSTIDGKDVALSAVGTLDLTDGVIDARLVLSGRNEAAGARPDIFLAVKGPVQAPTRTIDVSALTGWLTLRAVENQTRRLRAIENVPAQPSEPPLPKSKSAPALPAPINIKPVPKPRSAGRGAASIRSQN